MDIGIVVAKLVGVLRIFVVGMAFAGAGWGLNEAIRTKPAHTHADDKPGRVTRFNCPPCFSEHKANHDYVRHDCDVCFGQFQRHLNVLLAEAVAKARKAREPRITIKKAKAKPK